MNTNAIVTRNKCKPKQFSGIHVLQILLVSFLCISVVSCHIARKTGSSTQMNLSPIGNWQLQFISGPKKSFDELFPRGLPEIFLDTDAHSVSGNTGCNRMNGIYQWEHQKISFSQLVTTKMACKGGGEAVFLETLQRINQFDIQQDTLYLQMGTLTMMRFVHKF